MLQVQFSSVSGLTGSSLDTRDDSAEIVFQSAGRRLEQLWHGQGCLLFDVVHPAFPLPTTASSTRQGTLKDGFREAVVARDMPEPCEFKCATTAHHKKERRQQEKLFEQLYVIRGLEEG